jgi:hypothetical protein
VEDPRCDQAVISAFRARKVHVWEMDVEQGLPEPFAVREPSVFGLNKPGFWWRRPDLRVNYDRIGGGTDKRRAVAG